MTPYRCEKIALALLARTVSERGEPKDWRDKLTSRLPPVRGWGEARKGLCPLCQRESYMGGDWREKAGRRSQGQWHSVCVVAYKLWTAPRDMAREIAARQAHACPETGESLFLPPHWGGGLGPVEIDHKVPLWRVREEAASLRWIEALSMWGFRNLQALTPGGHSRKTAREATERANQRRAREGWITAPLR